MRVNTATGDEAIAVGGRGAGGGRLCRIWASENHDGAGMGIFAQRFDAAGTPLGSETQLNTTATFDQLCALDRGAGGWRLRGDVDVEQRDGSDAGIIARLFDADGNARTGEALVNTANERPVLSSVTGLADGGYVVT